MRFRGYWSHPVCVALLLVCGSALAPNLCSAQPTASQPAPTQSAAAQPNEQQAYQLPPDKLAKAISLSRIRNIMDIVGSLWGLAVLWVLLAWRGAAGLGAWAEGVSGRRWLQGLVFFAALVVVLSFRPQGLFGSTAARAQ